MGGEVEAARAIQSERAPRPQEAPAHPADAPGGLLRAVKTLADRIEAIERRSSSAAAGTDETVQAAIARLVEVGREQVAVAARFEGAVSEIGAEQARMADRLRRIESEGTGPRSAEALRALEANLGKMAGHLYEGEGRTREAIEEIGAKLRRVEVGQSAQPSRLATPSPSSPGGSRTPRRGRGRPWGAWPNRWRPWMGGWKGWRWPAWAPRPPIG